MAQKQLNLNTYTDFVADLDDLFECSEVGVDDNSWMDILIKEALAETKEKLMVAPPGSRTKVVNTRVR